MQGGAGSGITAPPSCFLRGGAGVGGRGGEYGFSSATLGKSVLAEMPNGSYVLSKDGFAQFTNKSAANRYSEDSGKTIKLSTAQREALEDYQVSSAVMNTRLRNSDSMSDAYTIRDLDAAMNKTSLADNIVLFRGVSGDSMRALGIKQANANALKGLVGKSIRDRAYLSTSTDQSVMAKFSKDADGSQGVGIIIKAAKGSRALPVSAGKTAYGNRESEFILPRRASLKVTGITERNGTPILIVEYRSR